MALKEIKRTRKGLYISGYASTPSVDGEGEVITAESWKHPDSLTRFLKNPVLLLQHKWGELPVGNVTQYRIDGKGLWIRAFVSKSAEKRYGLYDLLQDGSIRSFSVGFVPKNYHRDKATGYRVIDHSVLHEVSLVSLPCNQDCVADTLEESTDEAA